MGSETKTMRRRERGYITHICENMRVITGSGTRKSPCGHDRQARARCSSGSEFHSAGVIDDTAGGWLEPSLESTAKTQTRPPDMDPTGAGEDAAWLAGIAVTGAGQESRECTGSRGHR